MINYKFYIEIDINGNQRPFMMFNEDKNYSHLGNLANGRMLRSRRVKEVLDKMNDVMNELYTEFDFAGDDWCIVSFKKNNSVISNGFDDYEPFEIESNEIYKLLQDWYKFLCTYENGEIPGLTPNIKT